MTGRPVPADVLNADRGAAPASASGWPSGERCLLVFGGSLGARSINEAALDGVASHGPRLPRPAHLRYRDYQVACERLVGGAGGEYTLLAYEPGLADALAGDLVLARAGGSVFEIAAAGRPAILVPYPYATGGHQHANAGGWPSAGGPW